MPMQLNEVVDRGVNTAIQRRLGLSAEATVSLMPELAPTIELGPMPEIQYNLGWRRYAHCLSIAAGAAARPHLRFRVVPNANVLVALERLIVEGNGASNFVFVDLLGSTSTDLSSPFPNHAALDFRMVNAGGSLTRGSTVVLSTVVDGTAATLGVYYQGTVPAGTTAGPLVIPVDGVILTGGMGAEVDFSGLNQPAIVTWIWRERMMNDQEAAA